MGRAFVVLQILLLGALVVLPGGGDWPTPWWLHRGGSAVTALGVAIVVVAALRLGRSLTPTPVPKDDGQLATGGLYRFVRHPIYSGVLLIVVALVASSGRWLHLALGVATLGFFAAKARWEEARLDRAYPAYAEYAARTGRFVPGVGRRRR